MRKSVDPTIAIALCVTIVILSIVGGIFTWLIMKPAPINNYGVEVPSKDAPYILDEDGVKAICTYHEYTGWSSDTKWVCEKV